MGRLFFLCCCLLAFNGCDEHPWNDPYPYEKPDANVLYSSFAERPKHLDPARSYSEADYIFIAQIYEPPLQYHYLKRPYTLEPLTATQMPEIKYFDKYTDYIIRIKPGIFYQQHPAFAKNANGNFLYHHLTPSEAKKYNKLDDFKAKATRELIADDYVYQIKRLAEPHVASPIFGLMSQHIQGLKELRQTLMQNKEGVTSDQEIDLRSYPLIGATVIDRYTYRIRINGKYPQFLYWLSMSFFAPMPWEAIQFYNQPLLQAHNISLDWYPVGTGPFMLTENNPDRRMIMSKNPEFRGETYPTEGSTEDAEKGLLVDAGKPIPMVDKVIFTLEKEDIPRWNKFLQGYYDISGINSDNFGSSVYFMPSGIPAVTAALNRQNIRLQTTVSTNIWFWAFNFLDETVGGYSEKSRKFREAINLAFDIEEYIAIFLNGRGILATGPLPPDLFGANTQPKASLLKMPERIAKAKALLKEAGYPPGFTLYFDTFISGNPDEIEIQAWLKEQFDRININLVIRGTDYNRFQDKVRQGNVQFFSWGWNADYPDPENFLFLFYGPNSSAKFDGENMANYQNAEYDRLFEQMRVMNDGPERLAIIQKMINILERDLPWVWGFYVKSYTLYQQWVRVGKPSNVANNLLKYTRIDPGLRAKQRILWNKPLVWPFVAVLLLLLILIVPAFIRYWQTEHKALKRL